MSRAPRGGKVTRSKGQNTGVAESECVCARGLVGPRVGVGTGIIRACGGG